MSDVFNDNKFTILNEWIKWIYVYQHCFTDEVTHILKSRILNERVNNEPTSRLSTELNHNTQSSIILNELEDCMQEYLLLWMSDVFNDNRVTILNEWIK